MKRIIDGKQYDTEKANLIASNRYWDGNNWERNGRNIYLYKTVKGNFFIHTTTRWQGERDRILPVDIEEAKTYYEQLPEYEVDYKEVFGEMPEEV